MTQEIAGWTEDEKGIHKIYQFKDFNKAWQWMKACAASAQELDHHPDWRNVYNKVEVTLITHSAGNKVTDKDYVLAKIMEAQYKEYGKKA